MAALSVESARDGKKTGSPCIPASRSNVARNSRLAATPPLTKRVRTSYSRAAASVFVTRSLTMERWKEATRLSVCRSQSPRMSSSAGLSMPASDNQRKHRKMKLGVSADTLLKQHSMNVSLKVVHSNQRLLQRESECFGETDADEQSARQSRPLRDRDGIDGRISLPRFRQRLAHHRNNSA